jgi:hypothetical protein
MNKQQRFRQHQVDQARRHDDATEKIQKNGADFLSRFFAVLSGKTNIPVFSLAAATKHFDRSCGGGVGCFLFSLFCDRFRAWESRFRWFSTLV